MSDRDAKDIFRELQKNYGKKELDGSETFGPMRSENFDFKKHYEPLMQSYKNALWKLDEQESRIEQLERENAELCGRVGQKDRITKTTLSPDDYKIIKDDIEFEIRYHMQTNNPAHLDVCVENILNISAIYSEDK